MEDWNRKPETGIAEVITDEFKTIRSGGVKEETGLTKSRRSRSAPNNDEMTRGISSTSKLHFEADKQPNLRAI